MVNFLYYLLINIGLIQILCLKLKIFQIFLFLKVSRICLDKKKFFLIFKKRRIFCLLLDYLLFWFLFQGGNCKISGRDDRENYRVLMVVLDVFSFERSEQDIIFKIFFFVFYIGNIYFKKIYVSIYGFFLSIYKYNNVVIKFLDIIFMILLNLYWKVKF